MKHVVFEPNDMVCCAKIEFDIDNDKIYNLKFFGGCPGNLLAISRLVEGMDKNDLISKFAGVRCASKPTSCTDQLSIALKQN